MLYSLPTVYVLFCFLLYFSPSKAKAIDIFDVTSLEAISPNYCNNSEILEIAGLIKGKLGQFLGYECSSDFYHCRWQSDGFRTYRKQCKAGLVYDVLGTQNCNYDHNVNSCGIRGKGETHCNATNFYCPLSEQCLSMSKRCDGSYDCTLEEDEQNCPLCTVGEFACVVSEQCIALERRCNGIEDCTDGTDERNCNICGNGLFHCAKSGECVSINDRCDGKRQCPHGEDEMLCKSLPSQRFMCQSRDVDIAVNQVCDGVSQCPDGSDEMYCEVAVDRSISFSSNPNTIALASSHWNKNNNEEEKYVNGERISGDGPIFPMITLSPLSPKIDEISLSVLSAKSLWVSPSNSLPNMTPTSTAQKTTFIKPKRKMDAIQKATHSERLLPVQENLIRYPTKNVNDLQETPLVHEVKNQPLQQVIVRQTTPLSLVEKTYKVYAPIRNSERVKISSEDEVNSAILTKMSGQIQNEMTPELMAKIKRLISEELSSMKMSKPKVSRRGNLSPSAAIRTFTSR